MVILVSCGGKESKSYEATKNLLNQQEENNPKSFLSVEYDIWKSLIGQIVIEGDINSSSSIAKYKDIVLIINFYTKTDTKVGTEEYVIYEYVNPGESTHFKIKMDAPSETEKVSVEIDDAKIAD